MEVSIKMKFKITISIIASIVILVALAFGLEFLGLHWMRFFEPRRENIRREVFEQTKSYTHGKIQDLAKYYEEYQKANTIADKEAVASIIKIRFAEFDSDKIQSQPLKQFLIKIRGF
ncbi:hypothetical protein LCGC14_0883520 [marine sediment metagenome]|uniref:Chemotaxis methyl-accepting receptor HlyB-like 4HB MCP domain-containing protein n=1 Tax=marine sediment metagenome TaxID=412755 RepID=A0A0F9S878_9ZZZZ